jgi:hypothetical protein
VEPRWRAHGRTRRWRTRESRWTHPDLIAHSAPLFGLDRPCRNHSPCGCPPPGAGESLGTGLSGRPRHALERRSSRGWPRRPCFPRVSPRRTKKVLTTHVRRERLGALISSGAFLVLPAVSTWAAGFLFTCACLFVPTSLLAREGDSSARSTAICSGLALVCAPVGLLLSLQFDRMPTVPGIVALLATACVALGFLRNQGQTR